MRKYLLLIAVLLFVSACNDNTSEYDASGVFEATEVLISAEATGKLKIFNITEGDILVENQYIGYVDTTQLYLKKLQLLATKKAIDVSRPDIAVQISAIKEQIEKAEMEKKRIESLFKANAATQKQVDDAASQVKILHQTLAAQTNSLSISINNLNEQSSSFEIQIAQIGDQLEKYKIVNPINGTVLSKYAEEKELITSGKPLYKIADTDNLFLRAYLISEDLGKIKIGQKVKVLVSYSETNEKSYAGKIVWISDKAEFTPKTIQTKDERQNLVYAVKIAVRNYDKSIKIGMYGDVQLYDAK